MISYKITTTFIGVILFLIIFFLVRRGRLQEKYSLTWFAIGIIVVILGIFPSIIDSIAKLTGINYPPALFFVIAVAVLLIQNLYLFIFASQNEVRIKKLMQQVAVLDKLVEEVQKGADKKTEATKNSDKGQSHHAGMSNTSE